jgi:hypothetical protein
MRPPEGIQGGNAREEKQVGGHSSRQMNMAI